jgi:small subunit ribosomal protein S4
MTEKCAIERRSYPPGQHGQGRHRVTDYSAQLREKQKLRRIYGLQEKQFRGIFKKADRLEGVTGDNLVSLLERRLDNVVYRLGFAYSRKQARQMVTHGHIIVNGRKTNIPSFVSSMGDVIELRMKSRESLTIQSALDSAEGRGMVSWLEFDRNAFKGSVRALPTKDEIGIPVNEQVVVELYSR